MRTKSKFPKKGVCVRLRETTIEKIDKIAEKKELERSEVIRIMVENSVRAYELE